MKYECEKCNFNTNEKNKYERHLKTKRHQSKYDGYEKIGNDLYRCNTCAKEIKNIKGIHQHIKLYCKTNKSSKFIGENQPVNEMIDGFTVVSLLKSQNEALEKQNSELFNVIKELSIQKSNIHIEANTTNNTNSNNKTLNYQNITNYLNDKCADALNVEDFIPMIEVTLNDLMKINNNKMKRKDAVKMILEDNLNKLDFDKQPFKCSDIKRKKIYAKTAGEWINDDEYKQTKKIFRHINFKAGMKSEEPETKEKLEEHDMSSYELRKPLSYGCTDNEIEKHIESEKKILSEVTYFKND